MTNKAGDDRPGIAEALAYINRNSLSLDSIGQMREIAGMKTIGEYPNINALSSAIGTVARQHMENSGLANISKVMEKQFGLGNPNWTKMMEAINRSISGSFITAVQERAAKIEATDPSTFMALLADGISEDVQAGRVPEPDIDPETIKELEDQFGDIESWWSEHGLTLASGGLVAIIWIVFIVCGLSLSEPYNTTVSVMGPDIANRTLRNVKKRSK